MSTIRDYQSRFKRLLGKVGTLTNKQKMTCFISGLRELLWADVRAQKPTTISSKISLAWIYDGKNQEVKKGPNEYSPNSFVKCTGLRGWGQRKQQDGSPCSEIHPSELQKRREQGLFFHCDECYSFNQACKPLFWIEIEEEDPPELAIEATEEEELGDKPEIFPNAMVGMTTPQIMRVTTRIGKVPLTVLIDIGSTHNFSHELFTRLAGLHTESNWSLQVVVPNGERLNDAK